MENVRKQPIETNFYYGWVIVAVAAFSMLFTAPGQTYSISAFIHVYKDEFGFSDTMVSSIYSTATLCSGFLLFLMGKLVDRFGQRTMLVVCGILLAAATFFNSFINNIIMMGIGFFFLRYFGQGSLSLVPSTLVPQWFVKKRGLPYSLFKFGGTIGSLSIPLLNVYLISTYGWRNTWRVWSLLLLAIFVPIAWFLTVNRPEELGLHPDNLEVGEEEKKDLLNEIERESWHLSEAVKTRAFWLLGFVSSLTPMLTTGIVFHFISIMGEKGLSDVKAAVVLGTMSIPGFFLPIIAGGVIDRIGARKVLAVSLFLEALGIGLLAVSTSQILLTLAVLTYGAGMSIQAVASGVMWPNFFGRKYLGSIQGIATFFIVFGSAFGTIPVGLAKDLTGSYTIALIGLTIIAVLGSVTAISTHSPIKKHHD